MREEMLKKTKKWWKMKTMELQMQVMQLLGCIVLKKSAN